MKSLNQFIKESLIKENFGEFKNAQEVLSKIINVIKTMKIRINLK